jgi:ferredoxin
LADNKIKAILKKRYAINNKNWGIYAGIFQVVNKLAGMSRYPVIGAILKKILRFDRPDKNYTQGYVINLDQSLNANKQYQNVVLPITLVEKAIQESSYRSIMHKCICRDGGIKCEKFPLDFGCIFIGEGSRVTEKRGIARSASVDEALAHVKKGAQYGLVCQCIWVEAEEFVWGIDSDKLHNFLEICFCCPCCCVALKNYRKVGKDIQSRFRSVGWKAQVTKGCSACGACEKGCPKGAIRIHNNQVSVDQNCIGCGFCASGCPEKAIDIVQILPMKNNLQEYFFGFYPEL